MSVLATENEVLFSSLPQDEAENNFNHAFVPDLSKIILQPLLFHPVLFLDDAFKLQLLNGVSLKFLSIEKRSYLTTSLIKITGAILV